jgi:hypothetical protein
VGHCKLKLELLPPPSVGLNSHSVKASEDVELQTDNHLLITNIR